MIDPRSHEKPERATYLDTSALKDGLEPSGSQLLLNHLLRTLGALERLLATCPRTPGQNNRLVDPAFILRERKFALVDVDRDDPRGTPSASNSACEKADGATAED